MATGGQASLRFGYSVIVSQNVDADATLDTSDALLLFRHYLRAPIDDSITNLG